MKWFSIAALSALAFCSNACEKHAGTELPAEDREGTPYADKESAHGAHAAHAAPAAHGAHAAPEGSRHEDAPPNAAKHEAVVGDAHAEKTQGDAPKYFPERK